MMTLLIFYNQGLSSNDNCHGNYWQEQETSQEMFTLDTRNMELCVRRPWITEELLLVHGGPQAWLNGPLRSKSLHAHTALRNCTATKVAIY